MTGSDRGQTGVRPGSNRGQTTPGFGRGAATVLVFTTLAFSARALPARQQPAPVVNTEIYLADFEAMKAAGPTVAVTLVDISNSPDYDNQPSFTPDGKSILFSSKRDGTQYRHLPLRDRDEAADTGHAHARERELAACNAGR